MAAVGQPQGQKAQAARPDPDEGTLDGPISMTDLENKDPGKHYVFVARHKATMQEYKRMGYAAETGTADGVRVAGTEAEVGKEIECMDHVLMSCSAVRREKIEQRGAFNEGGQELADRLEKRMLDNRAIADGFRGKAPRARGREYFDFESDNREG